ncbi:hypothetical protein HDU98_005529 [Podochytrium sp. JEL0797]|nr:hypothetical protein HDU98_005529 [Podochytrium sp. JEL0797]
MPEMDSTPPTANEAAVMTPEQAAHDANVAKLLHSLETVGLGREKEQSLYILSLASPYLLESDIVAIKKAAYNAEEHPYIRGACLVVLSSCAPTGTQVIQRLKGSIGILESLTPTQLDDRVWYFYKTAAGEEQVRLLPIRDAMHNSGGWLTVAKRTLDEFVSPDEDSSNLAVSLMNRLPVNPDHPISPDLHLELAKEVVSRLSQSLCKACGERSRGRSTKKCAGCRSLYYCSKECQERDWEKGHKTCCRPLDDLYTGDLVLISGLVGKQEMNGLCGQLGRFNEDKKRWEVTWIHGSNGVLLKQENLTRMLTGEEVEWLTK